LKEKELVQFFMEPHEGNAPEQPIDEAAQQVVRQETVARPVRRARTYLLQAIVLAMLGGFAVLAFLANTVAYFPVDLTITHTIQLLNFAGFSGLMVGISWIGFFPQVVALVLIIGGVLYLSGLHWEALFSILLAGADQLANFLIKVVIQRPRPAADLVHVFANVGNYSFPSGHTMFYSAYFGMLFFLVYTLFRRGWLRTLMLVVLGGLVLLVGISRIYLGEHWASDVLAGYLLGTLLLAGAIRVYHWGKPKFFSRQPVAPEHEG
jgi:membrane-associated phospholipid phosphatase